MIGIDEMFAELDGYDRLEISIAVWSSNAIERDREYHRDPWNRRKAVKRVSVWRKANPERFAGHVKTWRDRNPEKAKAMIREAGKRWRAKNVEKTRETWRRNTAAYRARKAAAK